MIILESINNVDKKYVICLNLYIPLKFWGIDGNKCFFLFVVGEAKCDAEVAGSDDPVAGLNYPTNGAEWVELFVN